MLLNLYQQLHSLFIHKRRPPMNTDEQQCQGLRENKMEKAPCQQKAVELFSFLEKDRNTIYKDFSLQAAFQIPTCLFALGCAGQTKERSRLLDLLEFGSQRQKLRFTLRTKVKVEVQWTRTRFALVHNIGKIHTFGMLT